MSRRFCFPFGKVYNGIVELVPFSVPDHAAPLYNLLKDLPQDVYSTSPYGPFKDFTAFKELFAAGAYRENSQTLAMAIIDRTKGALVGFTALVDANPVTSSIAIGMLFVVQQSDQVMGLETNVIGALLQRALNPPSHSGLGLVRMLWGVESQDAGSATQAIGLGLKWEANLRWFQLCRGGLAEGKRGNGRTAPPNTRKEDVWQDITLYCICWDEWIQGGHWDVALAAMYKARFGHTALSKADLSRVAIQGTPGIQNGSH